MLPFTLLLNFSILSSFYLTFLHKNPALAHRALYPHCVRHRSGDPFTCSVDNFIRTVSGGFTFCNKTNYDNIYLAFGWNKINSGWTAKGWTKIPQNECKKAYNYPLRNKYYYYYAEAWENGKEVDSWEGSTSFCVDHNDSFEIQDSSTCEQTEGFKKINVGNSIQYTLNFR